MPFLLGKKISNKLYESDKSLIYRAFDSITKQNVILKILKTDCPDIKESGRYKNEYETIRNLDLENVIKAYSFERYNGSYVLILEDILATSLNRLYENRELTLEEFFDISIKIVKSLGNIHGKNIVHKNLNPSNIVYNPFSKEIKIIDFGIASAPLIDSTLIKGTLDIESNIAYISPEQTGKMDCLIDFRSDFYSLGITFYELLGGTLPYTDSDPMGMVHSHFAKSPLNLHKINSKIPLPVSNIVMKLIEKNPDERYQNSLSIIDDLTQCHYLLKSNEKILNFPIHAPSVSKELKISEELFGRNNEIDILSSLFNDVLGGHRKIAIISGNAGVGKTALVMEFFKKIVLEKAYFIFSKFDQIRQDIPYGAIVDVFSQLIQQVLMEKEPIFKQYQDNLRCSLGHNGQLMIDLFPELEHIIGPQNPVVELPIVEAQNRFRYVFHNFIRGFLNIKHPIVFFLDDLQWADASSLDFLKMILFAEDIEYGFFIGAFRKNEINSHHPWQTVLNDFKENGFEIHNINLEPLNFIDVNQFVSESLLCSLTRGRRLSELIEEKTLGNPFFIKEFLKLIYEKKILEFDKLNDSWKWKLSQIKEMDGTDPIVTLVEDKLKNISVDIMNLLKIASCLGNSFYIDTLSLICGMPLSQVLFLLDEAIKQGIVMHIKNMNNSSQKKNFKQLKIPKECKFSHDRFLNAVYSRIGQKDKFDLHWKIGNLLLKAKPDREDREDLLEIVNHLNMGKNSIIKESQKHKLAQVNLLAAKKTKRASAYQAAFSYLETGISVFCPDLKEEKESISPWDKDYNLCLSLHEKAVETAFLISRYDKMENLAGIIDKKARKLIDKVNTNEVIIRSLYARNRMYEAIDLGLSFSRKLGERLPKNPTKINIIFELFKTKFLLKGKNIEQLANLPIMTNPEKLAVLKILSSLVLPAFYASPNLVPLIVFKGICLSIEYGNTEESLFGYAGYGLILCGITGEMHIGYQFGELAQTLLDRLHAGRIRARTMATIHAFIRHWKIHIRETLPPLLEAHQSGLEFGDHQYAAICAKSYCSRELFAGIPLEKVAQDTKFFKEVTIKLNQDVVLNSMLILNQVVDNLTGKSKHPWLLQGKSFSYEKMVPLLEQSNDQMGMFTAALMNLILCFLFGKYDLAIELLPKIRKYLSVARGMPDRAVFNLFESLSILSFLQSPEARSKNRYLRRVKKNQAQMKKWSLFAPMNFENLYCLVEAERSNFNKDSSNAKKYYDLAIKYSNQNEYINYEALSNELAGRYHLKQQDLETAKDYILAAHYSYVRWGALGKSADMEKKYSLFFHQYSSLNMKVGHQNIDISAILKSSRVISKTMEFDRLVKELLQVVIEYSGAQKACLLLYSDKALRVEGIAKTDPDKIELFNSTVVDGTNREFPLSVLYYSIRSRQSVILNEASKENKFSSDPYLIGNKPLSILCKPLVNKNTVTGILYLENNLLKGAFSEKHLNILDIFTSQILISIENSKLYETLLKEIENKDKAVSEIKTKQELLQNISAELVAAEERERKTIAEDLHDSVSQSLAFSISRLKSLNLADLHNTTDQLLEILTYLNQAANNIRSLTFQLSPPLLKDLDFEDSLEWLCEDFFTRYGLKIRFKNRMQKPACLDETVKLTLYRVVRELAINIVKHANVKTAELNVFSENNYFFIILEDNGIGFDVQVSLEKSQRFGLFSIYQRMKAINGEIEIFSEKTKGTKITIKIALPS